MQTLSTYSFKNNFDARTRFTSNLRFLLLSILLLAGWSVNAQTGTISGRVNTSDGQAAEFVNVVLKGTTKGTNTNEKGEYRLERVKVGTYTLEVLFLGLQPSQQSVEVKAGEELRVDFTLTENHQTLSEVIVTANTNKFANKKSEYVARLPLENLENPQVFNVVTKELLKEQVVISFDDAVKNTPGVNRLWTSTGRAGDGAGYFSMRGFSVQPTMINGVAGQTNGGIDPANIERIESIKGPSGTLFGSSLISFGGLMNVVTKKPYETFGGEISYTGGSYDLNRLALDVNTPLSTDQKTFLRINSSAQYQGSFQDAGFRKSFFVAPSLSFKANEKLSFLINTEYMAQEGTNTLMIFLNRTRPLIARNPSELLFDYNRSYTSDDITLKNTTLNLFGQATYKLSDQWTSQTNVSRSIRKSEGYYSYLMYLQPDNDTLISQYLTNQHAVGTTTDLQQNFIGDFFIGNMRNRIVAGFNFMHLSTHNNNSPYILFNTINTSKANDPRYAQLTRSAVEARLGQLTSSERSESESKTTSVYVSDVFNLTPALMVMASLRYDHFQNIGSTNFTTGITTGRYSQNALSPKLGVVYQVVKDKVAVFGNYMNGYRNVAPVTQPFADINGTFKPQQANQFEGGVKLDIFQNRISLTASYYDILVNNLTRPETITRDGQQYNITVQDGSQSSKGVELDLVANPVSGLNLVLGYAHNNSNQTKIAESLLGRRPTSAGPADLANFWASYSFRHGPLKGLGLGFGGNYAGENKITNNSITGEFTLPAYTVLNSSLFYSADTYRISLKVDNLANERYFGGWSTVEPQMPRRVMASLAFQF